MLCWRPDQLCNQYKRNKTRPKKPPGWLTSVADIVGRPTDHRSWMAPTKATPKTKQHPRCPRRIQPRQSVQCNQQKKTRKQGKMLLWQWCYCINQIRHSRPSSILCRPPLFSKTKKEPTLASATVCYPHPHLHSREPLRSDRSFTSFIILALAAS